MKVLHLSTAHPALDNRIFYKECLSLSKNGFGVGLVARYGKAEEIEGVRIRPVQDGKNRFTRMTCSVWNTFVTALRDKSDIFHFHDPELITAGFLLKGAGKRVIYDVHEDLPRQILDKYWIPQLLRSPIAALAGFMEWLGGLLFDGIVAATPKIAERFPKNKTVLVQNFPRLEEFSLNSTPPYESRPNNLAYLGAISTTRGIREMILAIDNVKATPSVRLLIAGDFRPDSLKIEMESLPGWKKVDYLGYQPRSGVTRLLDSSRIGLVLLHPTPSYVDSYPVKLFEYMAAGIPVIASDFPLWRSIVAGARCGLLVDPMDPKAISEAVNWLLTHPEEAARMGERGREAVKSTYNWKMEEMKLVGLYRQIAS